MKEDKYFDIEKRTEIRETSLGFKRPDEIGITLVTIMAKTINEEDIELKRAILKHEEGVDLIPGNIELSGLEVQLSNVLNRELILKEFVDSIREEYEYILIDCAPSLGMMTINALVAADEVIIPVQAAYLPVKGFSNPAVFDEDHYMYVDYAEGIYIGYRYYETRWVDNETGECDEEAYHAAVQYPFGYGLSYTDFTQEIEDFEDDGENIIMKVKVTNTGDTAGKDVVQVYYTAPYYVGGIEKSHVNLINYGKTELLQPGESDTIEISFKYEDMASYDYEENCSYVLEHGKYEIKLMNNSHDVIDSRSVTVNEDVIYNEDNAGARSSDETTAVNHFDDVSTGNDVKYVSRADWEGTIPTERAQNKEATDEIIEAVESREVDSAGETEDIVVKDHGLTLDDMKGLDYDDPKWDELLEQISVDEMENLISFGGYATQEIDSIDKTQTSDQDGPAGINSLVSGNVKGIQYPSEVVIASTWNQDLAEKYIRLIQIQELRL